VGKKIHLEITEIKDNSGYEHDFIGTVNGEVVGRAELLIDKEKNEAEFRIHLRPEWQNRGYGAELSRVAVREGLKYLKRIWLGFDEGNERARKIYEKLGFKYYMHKMEIRCIE
jgi:RimJ/RimL family protein N-acetyltransferase